MSRNCDYIMKLGWKEMIQTRCGNMWKQSPSMSISALNCIGDSNILSLLKLSKALRDWCPSIHRSLTQPFLRQGTPVLTLLFLLSCLGWLKAAGGDALDKWLDNDRWGWDWTNNILALWNLGSWIDWSQSTLNVFEGMTLEVRMSVQSHLLRQARQSNLERYDTSVSGLIKSASTPYTNTAFHLRLWQLIVFTIFQLQYRLDLDEMLLILGKPYYCASSGGPQALAHHDATISLLWRRGKTHD